MIWPPTRDMGGVLSLSVIPTAQEYQYCGFDFIIPFASAGIKETLINTVGANVIPTCSQGTRVWADETGIVGYFLADDTIYDVDLVRSWYNKAKEKTNKPIGSIFWRPPHDTDRNRLISISNFLDFILPYWYPYRDGASQSDIDGLISYMIDLAHDLNCPVILGAQAMDDDFRGMADPGEAGVRNQYEKYHNAGFPIWWYSWTNLVTDVKRNYQHLMHEFYTGVAPLPYPCPHCPATFTSQAELDAHIASEHPITPVGTTRDTMFQSLGTFEGEVYAGTYNRDWSPVAIYSYPPPFGPDDYMGRYDTGESIYKFCELNNRFYAATESKGWIMRLNEAKTDWEIVYNGGRFNLILNLFRFKGYAYAYCIDYRQPDPDLYDGKIVRSSDGINWSDVWIAGDKFLPDFVEYEDELYALGGHQNGTVWAKKSFDGLNWSDVPSLSGIFVGRWNCVVTAKGKMWVVRRVDRERKLYSYNDLVLTEVFSLSDAPPRSEITIFNNSFYLLLGPNGWSDPDNGLLYTSPSGEIGSWWLVNNFGNKSGRCMCVSGNDLYIGIQKTLYKMSVQGEIITDETIVHTCNVKISYRVSSYPENNDPLTCPNCGMALGVEGIRGSEQIVDEPTYPCPHCGATFTSQANLDYHIEHEHPIIPIGWVKPTGHTNPSGNWRNEANIYDGNVATYGYCDKNTISSNNWGAFLELATPALQSSKIRIYCDGCEGGSGEYSIDIDVYRDGSWVDVFSGGVAPNSWVEKTFVPGSVTKARVRLYKNGDIGWTAEVKEFEFESQELQEVITTETILCSKCGSQLELKVSSIPEKNIEQFCPVCGEPAD